MGARPEDYESSAPRKSYIHVDQFPNAEALAQYLHKLDKDDDLYNEYFAWKGTGEFINTYFFCRLCALMHDAEMPAKEYINLTRWWRIDARCRRGSWNETNSLDHQHPGVNNIDGAPIVKRNLAAYRGGKSSDIVSGQIKKWPLLL
jgi:glycoprotein 3-alpha-L-fucosyltransferase